jgi:hypothetical protein
VASVKVFPDVVVLGAVDGAVGPVVDAAPLSPADDAVEVSVGVETGPVTTGDCVGSAVLSAAPVAVVADAPAVVELGAAASSGGNPLPVRRQWNCWPRPQRPD